MYLRSLNKVFKQPRCIFVWLITSLSIFVVVVWWPNFSLIEQILRMPNISLYTRLSLPISLLFSIATNFTPLTASYVVITVVLFGLNLAMISYYLKYRISNIKKSGLTLGFFGLLATLFGLGCSACGPLLITSLLSLFGASGILMFLPFKGEELGIIGVLMLLISIYMLAKEIESPSSCQLH